MHTRLSTSTSISTSDLSSNVSDIRTGDSESDFDTYALARAIGDLWKVDDPELVVMRFGASRVADVHRRMLYMSRKQKLKDVRSLDGYFMSILIRKPQPKPAADERSDDHYERYLERQKERGA